MTETPDAATLPRETGQEKATATCPNCGGTLPVVETTYGTTHPGTCPKCFPAPDDAANTRQQAGATGPGTLPREVGTTAATGTVTLPTTPSTPGGAQ